MSGDDTTLLRVCLCTMASKKKETDLLSIIKNREKREENTIQETRRARRNRMKKNKNCFKLSIIEYNMQLNK